MLKGNEWMKRQATEWTKKKTIVITLRGGIIFCVDSANFLIKK